ncbi:hypothetical protein SteCoe_28448 [Stentor coeruleus]|uniref:Uncharacterized protein n=1 Tax=Stentor coeruleus TaxID=5963 RepID=A0A1R2B8A2_9CILI|nr:hypothetical protein SteCoe_28448 [Stentor coeruleus]
MKSGKQEKSFILDSTAPNTPELPIRIVITQRSKGLIYDSLSTIKKVRPHKLLPQLSPDTLKSTEFLKEKFLKKRLIRKNQGKIEILINQQCETSRTQSQTPVKGVNKILLDLSSIKCLNKKNKMNFPTRIVKFDYHSEKIICSTTHKNSQQEHNI